MRLRIQAAAGLSAARGFACACTGNMHPTLTTREKYARPSSVDRSAISLHAYTIFAFMLLSCVPSKARAAFSV